MRISDESGWKGLKRKISQGNYSAGPGLSKVEVIHCLVHGRRTPENRPRCLLQRGQGNFKLAANFGYSSRGSADPRESLRKRRILKLALNAHTVLLQTARSVFRLGAG